MSLSCHNLKSIPGDIFRNITVHKCATMRTRLNIVHTKKRTRLKKAIDNYMIIIPFSINYSREIRIKEWDKDLLI